MFNVVELTFNVFELVFSVIELMFNDAEHKFFLRIMTNAIRCQKC